MGGDCICTSQNLQKHLDICSFCMNCYHNFISENYSFFMFFPESGGQEVYVCPESIQPINESMYTMLISLEKGSCTSRPSHLQSDCHQLTNPRMRNPIPCRVFEKTPLRMEYMLVASKKHLRTKIAFWTSHFTKKFVARSIISFTDRYQEFWQICFFN